MNGGVWLIDNRESQNIQAPMSRLYDEILKDPSKLNTFFSIGENKYALLFDLNSKKGLLKENEYM